MHRYFSEISFMGLYYHGWQIQNNALSVQELINRAFSFKLKKEINVVGCGRTDTEVNATKFFLHFDYEKNLSPSNKQELIRQLNKYLPNDISVNKIFQVKNDSHSRFNATSRTYQYQLHLYKNPFLINRSYYYYFNLDMDAINEAASILTEYTDFTSFAKLHSQTKTNDCQIEYAKWTQKNNQLIFEIKADRFLRNMVRAIVGTLIEVGRKKMSLSEFKTVIKNKNRSSAGVSVPGYALYLTDVEYPNSIFID